MDKQQDQPKGPQGADAKDVSAMLAMALYITPREVLAVAVLNLVEALAGAYLTYGNPTEYERSEEGTASLINHITTRFLQEARQEMKDKESAEGAALDTITTVTPEQANAAMDLAGVELRRIAGGGGATH